MFLTQRPPDDWPDALDHLAIGLVANKYTKLGKTSEILLLSQGLSYMKIPLCYYVHIGNHSHLDLDFTSADFFLRCLRKNLSKDEWTKQKSVSWPIERLTHDKLQQRFRLKLEF